MYLNEKKVQIYLSREGNTQLQSLGPCLSYRRHISGGGLCVCLPSPPHQLTDGYLQGDAGGLREGVSAETR